MSQPEQRLFQSVGLLLVIILSLVLLALAGRFGFDHYKAQALSTQNLAGYMADTSNRAVLADGSFAVEKGFSDTAREVLYQMQNRHYRQLTLTEKQASDFMDHFVDQLDPTRSIFLASDIIEFKKQEKAALSALVDGDLEPFFDVYAKYQQRIKERYLFLVDYMQECHDEQDFTLDETLDVGRLGGSWPNTVKELDELWRLQHKNATLNLLLTEKDPAETRKILEERYERSIKQLDKVRSDDVFVTVMNMVTTFYDPHSQYFSPKQYENFAIRMNLSLQGLGIVLTTDGEYIKVQRLIPGGPADLSRQIRAGDRIVGVGQGKKEPFVNVIGWRLDDVVPMIRGEVGSTVRLQVIPVDSVNLRQTRVVSMERNEVRLEEQAAQKKMLDMTIGGQEFQLGVIKVPTFYVNFDDQRAGKKDYRSSTRDVLRLLKELETDGAQGLIVDLRDNGGGSLEEAISLSGLFAPSGGPVLQVREENGRIGLMASQKNGYQYRKPVVVIVNRLSASASEIFAAALQDYRRAVIVGERTYGKGTVQRIIMLANGQLKYTSAIFYRINGETTQHQGVMPDIVFPSYLDHKEIGESALKKALPADRIRSLRYSKAAVELPTAAYLVEKHLQNNLLDPDYVHNYKTVSRVTKQREKKKVSLNLSDRKAESDHEQALRLEYENERRRRKQLPLLNSFDELDDEKSEEEEALESEYSLGIEDSDEKPDVTLRAAARILAEMIRYQYRETGSN